MPRYSSLFDRLLANSIEDEKTGCWLWIGAHRKGYPRLTMRRPGISHPSRIAAHRAMAELVVQRVLHPVEETIEHTCLNTACINPLHFALASNSENVADMNARRFGKQRRVFKPLVDPTLYIVDPLVRSLPTLRSEALHQECPF